MTRSHATCLLIGLALGLLIGILVRASGIRASRSPATPDTPTAASTTKTEAPPGRWSRAGEQAQGTRLSREQQAAIRQLQSLGYLGGSRSAPQTSGVTVHDGARVSAGLNLVVSGHAPEASLMDMRGAVLHTWRCSVNQAWPDFTPDVSAPNIQQHTCWRRARLLPNGELLAVFERIGIIKLDKDSRVLWAVRNRAHHDLRVARNGNIYVLTGRAYVNTAIHPTKPIWEDFISILGSDGRELRRVSVLEALRRSDFSASVGRAPAGGDLLHTNTLELIESLPAGHRSPFRPGSALVSMRNVNLVCAIDLETEEVYWAESALWRRQHQPVLLASGNLLVFSNEHGQRSSAVLELEPTSRRIVWSYVGGRDGEFYSETCGSNQRLANGNTLITESDGGRAFEVTPEKAIVWEYVNPHRTGNDRELIATLFEVERLPERPVRSWLERVRK